MSLLFSDKAEDCGAARGALEGGEGGKETAFLFGSDVAESEAGTSVGSLYLC